MKASTRLLSSSWLREGSLFELWLPGESSRPRCFIVSDLRRFRAGEECSAFAALEAEDEESHVSDFRRCLVRGGWRPSVRVFHVHSRVSPFLGRAILRGDFPSGLPLAYFLWVNLDETRGFSSTVVVVMQEASGDQLDLEMKLASSSSSWICVVKWVPSVTNGYCSYEMGFFF